MNVSSHIQPGMVLSGCLVEDRLGGGGMGVVFRGRDLKLNRPVAIKTLRDDLTGPARERFLREAAALGRISHPSVTSVYAYGEEHETPYLILEYVDGRGLDVFIARARLIESGRLSPEDLAAEGVLNEDPSMPRFLRDSLRRTDQDPQYVPQINFLIASLASGLHEAHVVGVIHRDIKPANILVNRCGQCKLADFGLSKLNAVSDLTQAGQLVGSVHYMAPEQFQGRRAQVTSAADLFSLGVVFYELLTLRHPFAQEDEEDLVAVAEAVNRLHPPVPSSVNPNVPGAIDRVVMRCLEKDPARRFATAGALALEIRRCAETVSRFTASRICSSVSLGGLTALRTRRERSCPRRRRRARIRR